MARIMTKQEVLHSCFHSESTGCNELLVCQFKNGIETQHELPADILRWMYGREYIYGETWRCWTEMPTKEEEKMPWESKTEQKKPPTGLKPAYVAAWQRIGELIDAIKRQYESANGKPELVSKWAEEIGWQCSIIETFTDRE